ncbi:MAG: 5-formyltetrahydrofolate cyclo-ligase [Xanthomonadales bacterium]|nr:5-formyltetrahydrofolate cyclo-ligase [Xanthomonadales bacterium]
MSLRPDKSALRRQARARRVALAAPERARAERRIADLLEQRRQAAGWRRVAAYLAVRSELDLSQWLAALPAEVALALPAIDAGGILRFRAWRLGDALEAGAAGIPQPTAAAERVEVCSLDAVILPLVGFDAARHRLGSGAGHYDRALAGQAGRPPPPVLVGAAFSVQAVPALPVDPWDVPLHAVVTEQGWV